MGFKELVTSDELKWSKHIQTIRQQKPTNCLSVFDHFVGSALKGLSLNALISVSVILQIEKRTKIQKITTTMINQN